jgi:Transcription factor TFIIB repeat
VDCTDDILFLKYCPSKRDCCYHAISRDLSARPHEILKLKIRDVVFKTTGNYQYAEVVVNGKTGTRPIPLINSIPYLKNYLDNEHPQPSNPNAPLRAEVVNKKITAGKEPMGLAATVLYASSIKTDEKIPQKDVAAASGVTEVTIRNRFKDLKKILEN